MIDEIIIFFESRNMIKFIHSYNTLNRLYNQLNIELWINSRTILELRNRIVLEFIKESSATEWSESNHFTKEQTTMKQYQILDYQSCNMEDVMDKNGTIDLRQIMKNEDGEIDFSFMEGTYPVMINGENIIVPKYIYENLIPKIKNHKIVHISSFETGEYEGVEFKEFYLINEIGEIFQISTESNSEDVTLECSVSDFISEKEKITNFSEKYMDVFCKIFDSKVRDLESIKLSIIGSDCDFDTASTIVEKHSEYIIKSFIYDYNEMYEIMKKKDDELEERIKLLTSHIESMPDGKLFFQLEKHFYNLANHKS